MATNLYRVPTQGVGAGGEQIFDVFADGQHVKDPNDPRLAGQRIESLPIGKAPVGFQSQFGIQQGYQEEAAPAVSSTAGIRKDLENVGMGVEDIRDQSFQSNEEFSNFISETKDRFRRADETISRISGLAMPTGEEQQVSADVQELENMLQEQVQGAQERPLMGTTLKSGIASEIQNITQGNTRESLVLLRRMDTLNKKLARLQGNRKAQLDALSMEYDLTRQNVNDAMNFYKLTQPERVAVDEKRGIAYFQNPVTNEVYASKMTGFEPEEGAQVTRDTQDNFYIDGKYVDQSEFQRLGINADFVPQGSSVTLAEAKTGKQSVGELDFETRTVGGRVKRFAFDKKGNLVRTEDLGSSGGNSDGNIKLSSSEKKKLLSAGFTESEASTIENAVSQFGIEEVLKYPNITESQKKVIREVYGGEDKEEVVLSREALSTFFGIPDNDGRNAILEIFGAGKTNKQKLDELEASINKYRAVGYSDKEILAIMKKK